MSEILEMITVLLIAYLVARWLLTQVIPNYLHDTLRDETYAKEEERRKRKEEQE